MNKQILMLIKYNDTEDIKKINPEKVNFNDLVKSKGHKFFEVDGISLENEVSVLCSSASSAFDGTTYIVTSYGIYDSLFGKAANRNSIFDISGLVKEIKSDAKKIFKDKSFSIRKSPRKGKIIDAGKSYFACFLLDYDKLDSYASDLSFFIKISEFLNEERKDFLGKIEGLDISPVKFSGSACLNASDIALVRLSNGSTYTCDKVSSLKTEPMIIQREDDNTFRQSDHNDDIGMKLFLEANGYDMTVIRNKK